MPEMPIFPMVFLSAGGSPEPLERPPRRWILVDGGTRRDVTEEEYRAALPSCARIEVEPDPGGGEAVAYVCYR